MTNNPDQFFVNNDNDRELLRETIRKVQESDFDIPFPREGLGLPPVLFGRITTTWASPATTVEVQPVDPDDFTDDTSLDTVTVYVSYFGTPAGYETILAADEIILYLPFQGEDKDAREGVLISAFDGGTTASGTLGRLVDIDTSVVDEVTLSRSQLTYDITTGLVKGWTDAAQASIILEAIKWLGIEKGGIWYHKPSPVDSVSHPDHWFTVTWTMGTGSITYTLLNGTPVVLSAITIYVDRTGHIWQVETDTQPTPPTNYRYEHCSDPETYPDIIFTSSQGTTVIEADGECYQYVGTTEDTATSPVPTVGSTYATCEACETAGSNEQWKKCSDNSNAAVLSSAHTDVDYAWLCIGGVWVKCYNDSTTLTSATDPTVLKQCDNASPTACADLKGWPGSDDFGGSGCNSGSVNDTNHSSRWVKLEGGDGTITGGQWELQGGVGGFFTRWKVDNLGMNDGFTVKVDFARKESSWGAGTKAIYLWLPDINWGWQIDSDSGGGHYWFNGSYNSVTFQTSGTWELRRDPSSSTVKFLVDGVQKGTGTSSATIDEVRLQVLDQITGQYDNLIINDNANSDGTGNDVYTDPSGRACT